MVAKYEGVDPPVDYATPEWGKARRVNEWKNYISENMKKMWPHFTDEQKAIIAENADEIAGIEEWY